jgi:hypothetical protein
MVEASKGRAEGLEGTEKHSTTALGAAATTSSHSSTYTGSDSSAKTTYTI